MTSSNISVETQVRYMVQWFGEWSELQRQDFLPILAEKMASNSTYVNGIVTSMGAVNCQDKPMNLFQCRVKLFNEWFTNWSNADRDKLVRCISELDPQFGGKLQDEITGNKQVIESDSIETESAVAGNTVTVDSEPVQEIENQEVVHDEPEVPQVALAETNVAIEITAE